MSDPASLKASIEQTLNVILDPRECPAAKLPQMLELAKLPPLPAAELAQIPTISEHAYRAVDKGDPRLRLKPYLRQCYHEGRREAMAQCGVKNLKLDVVIDLDCTLVECIVPPYADSPFAVKQFQEKLRRETRRDIREFTISSDQRPLTLLYTVRPGAESFLKKLTSVANLYIYSQGKHDYVNTILGSLNWRELFRGVVICPQERQKSLRERMRELADRRETVLILDDQRIVWTEEDQELVLPVMKYVPLYKFDTRCEEANSKFEERLLQFAFDKSVPLYKELQEAGKLGFLEDGGEQLIHLERIVRRIHESMFMDQYTRPAIAYFNDYQSRKFRAKTFRLFLSPASPEGREANLKLLIERMGGTLVEQSGSGVIDVVDREDGCNSIFLLSCYFKDVPR